MAAFVTVDDVLGHRLLEEPVGLTPVAVGLVFLAHLAGTTSSPSAGRLGDRLGNGGGWLGGVADERGQWAAVVSHVTGLLVLALGLALLLRRTPPLAPSAFAGG